MAEIWKSDICFLTCCGISGLIGLFALVLATPAVSFSAALMFGIGLAVLLGVAATRVMCGPTGLIQLKLGVEAALPFGAHKYSSDKAVTAAAEQGLMSTRDDLKKIKGIGPKLEAVCNAHGVYRFDQIASWDADQVARMDAKLEGVKNRVSRDDWVLQAKALVAARPFQTKTGGPKKDKNL